MFRGWRSFCTAGNAKQKHTHQTHVEELRGKSDRSWCDGRSDREREKEREMFYLTTHSTHFIYGYMASDIWLRTILIVRKETRCRHIVYSYRLAARVLLYAPSHRQDSTYHGHCYTSRVPRTDPSWWTIRAISRSSQCSTTGVLSCLWHGAYKIIIAANRKE